MTVRPEAEREAKIVTSNVDVHDWGPTEPDEMEVLASLGYVLNQETGIFEDGPSS